MVTLGYVTVAVIIRYVPDSHHGIIVLSLSCMDNMNNTWQYWSITPQYKRPDDTGH